MSGIISFSCFFDVSRAQDQTEIQLEFVASGERIDEEAASIEKNEKGEVVEETGTVAKKNESQYSKSFWLFLLTAYVFLLLFNLTFNFEKEQKVQWFWEAVYTFLAIFVWDQLDFKREFEWYPGAIMQVGIVIYVFYFYFFRKKMNLDFEKDPN